MVKDKVKPDEVDDEPKATRFFYKHKYMNCYLTLNPDEVAEGKPGVKIHLTKEKTQPWGFFETDDEHVRDLIANYPPGREEKWLGKSIVEIEAKDVPKLAQVGREVYHRGVASALTRKAPK